MRKIIIISFVQNLAIILHHPICFLIFSSTSKYLGIEAAWIATTAVNAPTSGLYMVKIRSDLTEIIAGEIFYEIGNVKSNGPEEKTIQEKI